MDYQIRRRPNKGGEIRYSVVLELWKNGERKTIPGGTHDSERKAIAAGEKLLVQYEDDAEKLHALHGNRTLRDWYDEWLEGLTVQEATISSYKWRMENWILPTLGEVQLKNLTTQTIDRLINGPVLAHLERTSRDGALGVLRGCLKKAVKSGLMTQNPALDASVERTNAQQKAEKERKKVKTWNYEEMDKLLETAVGRPVESLVIFGLLAGLRPGEAQVVRWSDIDWTEGTVWVTRTLSRDRKFQYFVSPQTKSGASRQARLTSDAVFRLMTMRDRLEAKADGPVDPFAYIYPNLLRGNSTPRKQLRQLCKDAEVKVLWLHCLRHTHASILLENGATLPAVAKQLGHSNPTVTASVYWHLVDDKEDTISGVMDRALGKRVLPEKPAVTASPTAESVTQEFGDRV